MLGPLPLTELAVHLLVAVMIAWVLCTTLLVFLYAAGFRFDD